MCKRIFIEDNIIGVNSTAFGRKPRFFRAIPLSRFSLKMSRFFFAYFELENMRPAQSAQCQVELWRLGNQLPVLDKANSPCKIVFPVVRKFIQPWKIIRLPWLYRLYHPLCVSRRIDTWQIVDLSNKDPCPKISIHGTLPTCNWQLSTGSRGTLMYLNLSLMNLYFRTGILIR